MKKIVLIILMLVIIALVALLGLQLITLKYNSSSKVNKDIILIPKNFTTSTLSTTSTQDQINFENFSSRIIFENAEQFVKTKKLSSIEAARLYAYISTAYSDTIELTKNEEMAKKAVQEIMDQMYPKNNTTSTSSSNSLTPPLIPTTTTIDTTSSTSLAQEPLISIDWLKELRDREKSDGFYNQTWNGKIPKGAGYWKSDQTPLFPFAGQWKEWLLASTSTPASTTPPKFGSTEYEKEINLVIKAVSERTPEQEKLILEWAGGSGSETLSGIWQNKLWESFKKNAPKNVEQTQLNRQYAYMQKVLAQSLADAYTETWKIKYTYWTARPQMVIPDLEPFIIAPRTPSFPSEHAVVSKVAAEILNNFFPKENFLPDVTIAQNTRVWSGVEFTSDGEAGLKLGEIISKNILERIK